MGFNYSFFHNVIERTFAQHAARIGEAEGIGGKLAATGKAGLNVGTAAAGMLGAQLVSTTVREASTNWTAWDEHRKAGDLMEWLVDLAIQRTGINGPIDPLVQAYNGLKYDRSITGMFSGAQLGFFLQAIENMIKPTEQGSPYSNVGRYKQIQGAFNMFVVPLATMALTAMPGGPLTGKLFGASMMWGTSREASDALATKLVGPKGSTAPKPPKPGTLPGLQGVQGWGGDAEDAPAEVRPGPGGSLLGLADDAGVPVLKKAAPVVAALPGWAKLVGAGAAAVYAGSKLAHEFGRYTIPPPGQGGSKKLPGLQGLKPPGAPP